jgi:signal transduction histidine kinase
MRPPTGGHRRRDSGIGISPKDQDVVFEDPSARPPRVANRGRLGLAICRRRAGMLGGQLTVRGTLGEGATFTLTLPRSPRNYR